MRIVGFKPVKVKKTESGNAEGGNKDQQGGKEPAQK